MNSPVDKLMGDMSSLTAGNVLQTITGLAILGVVLWSVIKGKGELWHEKNVAMAIFLTLGAIGVLNTNVINYLQRVFSSVFGNSRISSLLAAHAVPATFFFLVSLSILYWFRQWAWPKIQHYQKEHHLGPYSPDHDDSHHHHDPHKAKMMMAQQAEYFTQEQPYM